VGCLGEVGVVEFEVLLEVGVSEVALEDSTVVSICVVGDQTLVQMRCVPALKRSIDRGLPLTYLLVHIDYRIVAGARHL
jgi:hypothetical protein